jgi:hypothetical protein
MSGKRLGACVIVLAWGCGGGTAAGDGPATAGTDEAASSARERAAGGDDTAADEANPAAGGDEAEGSSGSAESAASPLEGDDLQSVLRIVLSDAELIDSLHLEKPGRRPLKVAGPDLPAKLKVVAGSHDVKVVDEPASSKEAVLVFTKLERSGDQARVHYRFDVEGLKGRASLSLKQGRWELSSNRVVTK